MPRCRESVQVENFPDDGFRVRHPHPALVVKPNTNNREIAPRTELAKLVKLAGSDAT
jgi:hypothetical protein